MIKERSQDKKRKIIESHNYINGEGAKWWRQKAKTDQKAEPTKPKQIYNAESVAARGGYGWQES